jgi:hypothetical protein
MKNLDGSLKLEMPEFEASQFLRRYMTIANI